MAGIRLEHVYKVYPNGTKAVNDFTMEISDKEFIVFVGPSGCGKSTTLRMIAGLEEISAGDIYIGEKYVNSVEPKDRDVAMVFQNYALYPHMTVYDNMAFALRIRKLPKEEIDKRVRDAAEILGITDYLKSKPKDMSGGQRQRVALGRALVREPKVFLLDEPLSNLDAKLRTAMRSEISKLHKKIQTTFIYVTHDQVEAMTMGTRIVVMKDGYIQQIDTPGNLYNYPCNKFVAGFIGTPQMNFYNVTLTSEQDGVRVRFLNTDSELLVPHKYFVKTDKKYLGGDVTVVLGIRSEHISVDPEAFPFRLPCKVSYVENLGVDSQVYGDFNVNVEETVTGSETKAIIKAPAGVTFDEDSVIDVSLDFSHVHLFDAETEQALIPRVPQSVKVNCTVCDGELSLLGTHVNLPAAIHLTNGNYQLQIPIEAVFLGGELHLRAEDCEKVDGRKLHHLRADNDVVFVLCDDDYDAAKGVGLDFRKCIFWESDKEVTAAIPTTNRVPFRLRKYGMGRKATIKIVVGDSEMDCDAEVARKIVDSFGREAFKLVFEMLFDVEKTNFAEVPLQTTHVEQKQTINVDRKKNTFTIETGSDMDRPIMNGFVAEATDLLDYGTSKYVRCVAGDTEVYVPAEQDVVVGQNVYVTVDTSKIRVYSPDVDLFVV